MVVAAIAFLLVAGVSVRAAVSGREPGQTNSVNEGHRWERPPRPGQSGIQTGMTNTQNAPIEALERAYPLRVLRYRLRRGSGGGGLAPGGEGIERDLQALEDCTVSLITERRVSRPWGLAGGEPGAPGENCSGLATRSTPSDSPTSARSA
ncbi:MAG: hydantoinase B/oxoprolinase family protein [Acidimicrobiales bacterium]